VVASMVAIKVKREKEKNNLTYLIYSFNN